jgi:hypothetical protein
VDQLIDRQSIEADQEKRKQLVWEIERNWPTTALDRSSFTTAAQPAGSRMSRD